MDSCAAMNGIPSEITHRADELNRLATRGQDLVAACTVMSESEASELYQGVSALFYTSVLAFTSIYMNTYIEPTEWLTPTINM